MVKKIIDIIDVDGVLANYNYGIARIAMKLYGVEVIDEPRYIPDWYYCSKTLGKEHFKAIWQEAINDPGFLENLPALATAEELSALNHLTSIHDVYFVTSRVAFNGKSATERWLRMHGVYEPTVICSEEKGCIAKSLRADNLIEDSVDNIVDVLIQHAWTKVYLMEYPYNQEAKKLAYRCVRSIQEFISGVLE